VSEGGEKRVGGAEMRRVLGHFATGVTVVTAQAPRVPGAASSRPGEAGAAAPVPGPAGATARGPGAAPGPGPAAAAGGEPVGMVANSFTSVSLRPPLVLFCAGAESETWPRIREAERFCVNVLGHHQRELAVSFARKGTDRYEGVALEEREGGPPRLAGAIAHVDCRIWAEHPGGDHTIVVGEVVELAVAEAGAAALAEPLIFYRGGYTTARQPAE
jgi:flavin reductase (DIM6/NTAB) family NADH-FMN oxidoreductase RutF